jgi:hypothetical protein
VPDSPMKPDEVLHIVNGPVFSAYTNRWGADCSCGWKTSHQFHGFVDWAVMQHRRIAAGFRTKRRRERARDEKTSNMKTCGCSLTPQSSQASIPTVGRNRSRVRFPPPPFSLLIAIWREERLAISGG